MSVKSYAQTITLNATKANIENIFNEIEKQSGYDFFYKYKDINKSSPVNVKLKNVSIEEALIQCLQNTTLTYKIIDKTIIISNNAKNITSNPSHLKQNIITGSVKDETNQPIPGVGIHVKGNSSGTITDSDGKFNISASPEAVLIITSIGYKTKQEVINNQDIINIILEQNNNEELSSEVIVVGYGNLERRNLTSSVSTVRMSNINTIKKPSADLLLAGQLAGVTVNQVTGTPGGGVVVRVRGSASTGAGDDPLYVIDGFPISAKFDQKKPIH
ncbi:carboxypeptidase-like regulatory domain-containing protein [Pedobacter sp. NJ-S-72]